MPNSDATRFIEAYCDTLAGVEVQTVDGKKRDKARTLSVLKSLSRNIGTLATEATILSDVASHYASFSRHTLADNMVALDKLFVTDNLSAWTLRLRLKTRMRTSDKRYFVDPLIAASMLGLHLIRCS